MDKGGLNNEVILNNAYHFLLTYIHTYTIHTCIHNIHTHNIHTHTYMHTYIHSILQAYRVLCISGWLSVRNRQCLYKQEATSHTKSCTSIYSSSNSYSFEHGNGFCIFKLFLFLTDN